MRSSGHSNPYYSEDYEGLAATAGLMCDQLFMRLRG